VIGMVAVKEYSVFEENGKFYIDCLLRDIPINVKMEFEGSKFEDLKSSISSNDQINIDGKIFIFDKVGYISFPTDFVFFPNKNLIYTKMLALRLPKSLSESI
jgi:hypothetical protein